MLAVFLTLSVAPLFGEKQSVPDIILVDSALSLPEPLWKTLLVEFQVNTPREFAKTPLWMRSSNLPQPNADSQIIHVYLRGHCTNPWLGRGQPWGPLGWVLSASGEIQRKVFVDCDAIAQVLGPLYPLAFEVMARAIARVTEHELIHILTQSSQHTKKGIESAQLSVYDLTCPRLLGTPSSSLRTRSPLGVIKDAFVAPAQ